jgi:hypothetical protein
MACLEEAAVEEEAHRAVDSDVVVDARPYVEELWEIEAGVPEHRHRHPRALKLKLSMEELSKNRSKASLSRTNLRHPHLTWWM